MKKPNGWFPFLWKWSVVLTCGVTVTCISIWSGLSLWGFFSAPPSPRRPDSATSCPLERPAEKETLPKPDDEPEPAEEGTCAALRGDTYPALRGAGIDTIEPDETGYLTLSQRSSSALSLLTGFDTDTSTEVSKLEALEQLDEKWILTKAITCPIRLNERKLRRARKHLRALYSSRNPRKNPPRNRKTDSYDSGSLESPIRRSIMSKEFPDSSDSGSL